MPAGMDVQRLQLLLVSTVDDDLSDLRERLAEIGVGADVHVCGNASEALRLLQGRNADDGVRPDLVLLDIDVGDDSPLALLEGLRSEPDLERIAVIAIVGDEEGPQMDAIAGHRIHDTVVRPLDGYTVGRVVSYLNDL
jgi:CheY-like chemotaxis protein